MTLWGVEFWFAIGLLIVGLFLESLIDSWKQRRYDDAERLKAAIRRKSWQLSTTVTRLQRETEESDEAAAGPGHRHLS